MAKSKKSEWVPWYRRKKYNGNLTEEEKRHLDSFRLEEKHPAAKPDDLPEEVLSYFSELQLAVYDQKQDNLTKMWFLLTGFGAFLIFMAYRETGWLSPLFGYVLGGAMIAFAWIYYSREFKKNADTLWINQEGKGVPSSSLEKKFQEYWELDHIDNFRRRIGETRCLSKVLSADFMQRL
jgi:hypothetical protein